MRWLVSFCALTLLGLIHALSSAGNRLLVVIEEAVDREKYSQFWGDLEGMLPFLRYTKHMLINSFYSARLQAHL